MQTNISIGEVNNIIQPFKKNIYLTIKIRNSLNAVHILNMKKKIKVFYMLCSNIFKRHQFISSSSCNSYSAFITLKMYIMKVTHITVKIGDFILSIILLVICFQ